MSNKNEPKMGLEDAVVALTMRISVLEKLLLEKGVLKEEDLSGELEKIVNHLKQLVDLAVTKE